ncbi:MAG: DUF5024 domain-containing protein [Paludibacteraceae bacterium]|nr:DUF5024 domain-containing protein [Paludibacteraceae bacterium]
MKAKNLFLTMVAALIACSPVMAQSRIDKIVDEIEQKGVDVSKVVKRDPKTKKPYSIVKSLTFYSKDSNYANRLKEAFRKDAEDAEQESVSNKGNNYRLIFVDGKKRSIYSLNIQEQQDKDPRVSLRIIMRDGYVKENNDYDIFNSFFGTGAIELNGIDGLLEGLGNVDMEKFGRDMEKWGEDFGREMEKFGEKMEKYGKKVEKNKLRMEKKNNNA